MIPLNLSLEQLIWLMDSVDPNAPDPPLCNEVADEARALIDDAFRRFLNRPRTYQYKPFEVN